MPDLLTAEKLKSNTELGDELLQAVRDAATAYHAADHQERVPARERYMCALNRFNDFVLRTTGHHDGL